VAETYLYPLKPINSDLLQQEIEAEGLPIEPMGVSVDIFNIRIAMQRVLDAPEKATLDTVVANHTPPVPMRKRILYDILQDYQALSGSQRSTVWQDLAGPNAAAVFSLHWATGQGGSPTAIDVAKNYLASAYVQDNPDYLINPPFDTSIDISGEEPIG
jgi:hypothetical protein